MNGYSEDFDTHPPASTSKSHSDGHEAETVSIPWSARRAFQLPRLAVDEDSLLDPCAYLLALVVAWNAELTSCMGRPPAAPKRERGHGFTRKSPGAATRPSSTVACMACVARLRGVDDLLLAY